MSLFNETEQNLIKYMCPSCKDLYIILEKSYNGQPCELTMEQIYEFNHACYDLEKIRLGDIIKKINNRTATSISEDVVKQLNEGKHCPVLKTLGKMGDCFQTVIASFDSKTINEFDFEKFVELGQYGGIQYANKNNKNEKVYEYIGEDKYLYYNVFIPYESDYVFSYKTTIVGSIIIRFYDSEQNNISSEIINVINEGIHNNEQNGIFLESSIVKIPYVRETKIAYFTVGFEVEKDSYFSDLCLQKQ